MPQCHAKYLLLELTKNEQKKQGFVFLKTWRFMKILDVKHSLSISEGKKKDFLKVYNTEVFEKSGNIFLNRSIILKNCKIN